MRDAGRAVERRLEFRMRPRCPESRVGIGSGIEQRGRGTDESVASRGVKAQVLGQAQVDEGVHAVRISFHRGGAAIELKKPPYSRIVTKDGCRVDSAGGDRWMRGENGFSPFERAVPGGSFEEFRHRMSVVAHARTTLQSNRTPVGTWQSTEKQVAKSTRINVRICRNTRPAP